MNNLTDPNYIKQLFKHHGLKPKDYMGQNFLVDEVALNAVVSAAELKPTDTVLEVGPGLGVLTRELLSKAGKVIAVEKDKRLVEILEKKFKVERLNFPPRKGGIKGGRDKAQTVPPLAPPILGGEL